MNCRLCGKQKSPLDFNVELNDESSSNWTYRELIEHHTRVSIKADKILPKSVCDECKAEIDGFAEFSRKLQTVQNSFESDDVASGTRKLSVQLERIDQVVLPKNIRWSEEMKDCALCNVAISKIIELKGPGQNIVLCNKIAQFRIHLRTAHDFISKSTRPAKKQKRKLSCDWTNEEIPATDDNLLLYDPIAINLTPKVEQLQVETVVVKIETFNDSEKDSEDEYKPHLPQHEPVCRRTRSSLNPPKRRGRYKKTESLSNSKPQLYGSEIDSLEKLFEDEINGTAPRLHLNISEDFSGENGEVHEEFAKLVSPLRWRNHLSCRECKSTYDNINELTNHIENVHGKRTRMFSYTLCNCEYDFAATSAEILMNHMTDRHFYDHLKFCCMICSKMFYDLMSIANHYKTHGDEFELFPCLICGFHTASLDKMKEHKTWHMLKEQSESQKLCALVDLKFKTGALKGFKNPAVNDHELQSDGRVSDECQKRLTIDWSFAKYGCTPCSVTYDNPFDLHFHARFKHYGENINHGYACEKCRVERTHSFKHDFNSLFTFISHAIDCKHNEIFRFSCMVCSTIFGSLSYLAAHYREVHPPFLSCIYCNHCGKIFASCSTAMMHYNKEVLDEKERVVKDETHICHICAKTYKVKGHLATHLKSHELSDEPVEMVECKVCKKLCKGKIRLREHMVNMFDSLKKIVILKITIVIFQIIHINPRHHKCHLCPNAFNYKRILRRHIEVS